MNKFITCNYCYAWRKSIPCQDETNEGTKKRRRKSNELYSRTCHVTDDVVSTNSPACKWFKPASSFICYKDPRFPKITFEMCVNRQQKPKMYPQCSGCDQYDIELHDICKKFGFKPRPTLKRRTKPDNEERRLKRRFKLKRRNSNTKEVSLKRRKKPELRLRRRKNA